MSGGACQGRGAAAPPGSVSVGSGSGETEAGPENGAVRWVNDAEVLESGAGGGWESDAGLREQTGKSNMLKKNMFEKATEKKRQATYLWSGLCLHLQEIQCDSLERLCFGEGPSTVS